MKFVMLFAALASMHELRAYEVTLGFLDKIAIVESNGNDYAVGDKGNSLGCFQIKRGTWEAACRRNGHNWEYNKYNAFNYSLSRQVAKWHCEWIVQRLKANGITPNPLRIYMCYAMGFTGAKRHQFNTNIDYPALNRARKYL